MTKKKAANSHGKRKKPTSPPAPGESSAAGTRRRRWRRWAARLAVAVVAPTLLLLVVELGLRLFDYGYDPSYFIAAEDSNCYRSNPKFGWRFFGADLSRPPLPVILEAAKPENTYRVFVFGGSAAQGVPEPAFSFARILEAMLADRFAAARFEVINTAMVAINSHVVLPIARQCRGFDGDLFIVYLGNNEVVGPYGAGTVFPSPVASTGLIRTSIYIRSTRLGQLIGNTARAIAGDDSEARKQWGGMQMFLDHRVAADDPRIDVVYDNFLANLDDVCKTAEDAGVPLIISTVLTNLKNCPPLHSAHRLGLRGEAKARWNKAYQRAVTLQRSEAYGEAVRAYESAAEIDDQFAELHFHLGQCRLEMEQFDLARRDFVRARDLDTLRFRADTRINEIIRRVAGEHRSEGVYLVDAEEIAQNPQQPSHGIPGSELLWEHVHMNFQGNYLVAAAMFEKIVTLLGDEIRDGTEGLPAPPSVARCRELTHYTKFNRLYAAVKIAQITSDPPFPEGFGQRSLAEARRLEAELTPELLGQFAQQYRQALQQRGGDLLLRSVLAALESVRKEYVSAAEQYEALIRRYPHFIQWHQALGMALLGQGKTEEAIAKLRSVLRTNPNYVEARTSLASALAKTGQWEEATAEYGRALAIRPNHAEAHFQLGKLLLRHGQPERAEEHLGEAVDADPQAPRYHFFLGMALAKQYKTDQAVEQYEHEVSLFAEDPFPRLELARILLTRGQEKQAVEHLTVAVRSDPTIPHAQFLLGQLLLQSNKPAEAQAHFAAAIRLDAKVSDYHRLLARSLAAMGQNERAMESYRRAIELDAKSIPAINDLAWLYATDPRPALRNGSEAVILAQRAKDLSGGTDPAVLDTLAVAYAETGQFDRAVRTARHALDLAEKSTDRALADQVRTRLELYLADRPFHESLP